MITDISYKGVFISEAPFDGERSADGMTPNYAQGLRVSRDRWLVLYDTVDRMGRDGWRSIFYQLRAGGPDGAVLKDGMLLSLELVATLSDGTEVLRSNGQPGVFGVPKGARMGGEPMPNANVFAVTWLGCYLARKDGKLWRLDEHPELEPAALEPYHEIMHVRLNEAEDDIEVIGARQRLMRADGSAVGGHGWAQPVLDSADGARWLDSFSGQAGRGDRVLGHTVGVIGYAWNAASGLYEVERVSDFFTVKPGLKVSETNLVKLGAHDYVLAVRSFEEGGHTFWYRTADPFGDWGKGVEAPDTYGQRYVFRCADGVMRIFLNRKDLSPYGQRRNPLYCFDVDPADFSYSNQRVVLDARVLGLPFAEPFLDHVHLFEARGNRQLLTIRTIACAQVWRQESGILPTPQEMDAGGTHYVEIVYDSTAPVDADTGPGWEV